MEKELELISVNKKYKLDNKQTFQALYDINIEFKKGELVSIVGESGSGKSTLMNLIGGLDSDFTGDIISGGENLRTLTDSQLDKYRKNKVGFVFQSFNLISHLSILDNVTLALTLSNVGEKERVQKATDILKRVGLESQLKKKPNQLSGGQKQRVAIARALINDPEIIIADEPTGALDSDTSMQILEILKEIADSGKLVIMVTHSEKVASISSRVVEISDGRIVGDHKNKDYKKNPKNPLTAKDDKAEVVEEENNAEQTENNLSNSQTSDSQNKKKKRNFKDKQNLSLWSAIRLSVHNMWASKTKNFLMAFGVAIGIGSLILMMCFSSGITDFIGDTMKSYSNPNIATISKVSGDSQNASSFSFESFTLEERTALVNEVNKKLKEKEIDFEIDDNNLSLGFNLITLLGFDAKVSYTPDPIEDPYYQSENAKHLSIACIYTIPPYYSEKNVIEGEQSQKPIIDENTGNMIGGGGFMFTKSISKLFDGESAVGHEVQISFTVPGSQDVKPELPTPPQQDSSSQPSQSENTQAKAGKDNSFSAKDKICGIMDTSIMAGMLVVYVDYDYLEYLFTSQGWGNFFNPTTLYIQTPSESITNSINGIIEEITAEGTLGKYTGSIEDQLAGMFNNMTSVIGTSLIIISCISLLVSAMMILVVLYMSVSERTKEIGVLKSIGARRKDIKRIFSSESFLIGVLSGLCGIVFNLILTLVVWLTLTNTIGLAPITYRWWYFVVAMAVSIIISMLSGLYPASKAAKLDPVESLRRE